VPSATCLPKVAEVVKDAELAKAALARPGEVLRVPRGTTAEHLAAAGSLPKETAREGAGTPAVSPRRPKNLGQAVTSSMQRANDWSGHAGIWKKGRRALLIRLKR
jgi:hypothetical protein